MKGASQIITAALYVGISVAAVTTAVTVGQPAIENMRDASAISRSQDFMQRLDSNIQQVAAEGQGSSRTLTVQLDRGTVLFNEEANALIYRLESDAQVISPQSSRRTGNVVLSSNANVNVYNVSQGSENAPAGYTGPPCYMMENEHIRACIKKTGSPTNTTDINSSELLTHYEFKDQDKTFDGNFSVMLNGVPETGSGGGYTQVDRYGQFIGTGQVKAHVSSSYGFTYDIIFQLPTGADFLKVDVRNFS
ncbi:hypothetical protein [Candidatus Nanohalococcus occultus]|uniref:Secreted protein n=1 Tax=Candidatus Nanohalococcus occultus TaxID=2978047 RepID=A0ABY8CF43_9ARCH|nr:hypothetical protein SVXNc_0815 [Candidatus Nanohaloarchaeota archaeon SVXNc]